MNIRERMIMNLDRPSLVMAAVYLGYDLETSELSTTLVKPLMSDDGRIVTLYIKVDTSNMYFTSPVIVGVELENPKVDTEQYAAFIYRATVQVNKDADTLVKLLN